MHVLIIATNTGEWPWAFGQFYHHNYNYVKPHRATGTVYNLCAASFKVVNNTFYNQDNMGKKGGEEFH